MTPITPKELDVELKEDKTPPVKKFVETVKSVATPIVGGVVGGAAALTNMKPAPTKPVD